MKRYLMGIAMSTSIGLMLLLSGCGSSGSSPLPHASKIPEITAQPSDITGLYGDSAVFHVAAEGNPTPEFQWRKNGIEIVGATGATLNLDNLQMTDDGSQYDVIAHNSMGNVLSTAATLHVNNIPGNVAVKFVTTQAGTITGTDYQSLPMGGSTTAVSVTPKTAVHPPSPWSNYYADVVFYNWTGPNGFVSTDNPLVLTDVQTDMTLQANYTGNKPGCLMTDITGIDSNGADTSLFADKGSVIVLDVSGGSNPYSQENAPLLEELYQRYKDQGLKVVTVLPQDDQYSTPTQTYLQTWATTYGLTFKVMNDTTMGTPWGGVGIEIYSASVNDQLPAIVIFDKKGVIQFIQAGFDPEAVDGKVQELLAQ